MRVLEHRLAMARGTVRRAVSRLGLKDPDWVQPARLVCAWMKAIYPAVSGRENPQSSGFTARADRCGGMVGSHPCDVFGHPVFWQSFGGIPDSVCPSDWNVPPSW